MKYTSAEAAKLLRNLNEEIVNVRTEEMNRKDFLASLGEDPETVRPSYDYREVQDQLMELERKVRMVKHAINLFNTTHIVPGTDMTIDEVLIYIPQLTERKRKLGMMMNVLPKQRENNAAFGHSSPIIDYRYANYDVDTAKQDYYKVSEELSRVQTALDLLNSTETMEISL